ncbi:MAG: NAD(P)/FAD-dependent oxidoreductase [Thermoplasmata archaeon]
MANGTRPRIVILGAGFGGLWAARALRRASVDVVLIDRNNYHTFFPLLYQVAAAELEPEDIAYPVRTIVRKLPNVQFLLADVQGVDLEAQKIATPGGSVSYDYIILATGSTAHFFGVPGAEEHAFPLRTLEEGVALRNHILRRFERAAWEPDPQRRRELLTFVIVGGGPTGVEFAGALAELVAGSLARDYPRLDFREVRVILFEAADRLLPVLPSRLSAYAHRRLQHLGVEVHLETLVARIEARGVHLQDGSALPAETVIWTAGVQGSPPTDTDALPADSSRRLSVEPTLQVPGHSGVYALGDLALLEGGESLPMLATVAIQQGTAAARNIVRQIRGHVPRPFRYEDLGTLAVIGRNAAIAHLFSRAAFTGFFAWILWLGVHLFRLIGFRNRLVVLSSWAVDYLLFERVVRLILPSEVAEVTRETQD